MQPNPSTTTTITNQDKTDEPQILIAKLHVISTSPVLPLRRCTWPSNAEVVSLLENFAWETHRKLHPDGASQKIATGKWSTPWTRAFQAMCAF